MQAKQVYLSNLRWPRLAGHFLPHGPVIPATFKLCDSSQPNIVIKGVSHVD